MFINVYWSKVEERMNVSLCLSLAVLLSVSSLTLYLALNMGLIATVEKTG